jgi:hypothetical protein
VVLLICTSNPLPLHFVFIFFYFSSFVFLINTFVFLRQKIDHDCSLVPRGFLVVDAAKRVIPSAHYGGLSFQTATESRAYLHYRQPESLQGEDGKPDGGGGGRGEMEGERGEREVMERRKEREIRRTGEEMIGWVCSGLRRDAIKERRAEDSEKGLRTTCIDTVVTASLGLFMIAIRVNKRESLCGLQYQEKTPPKTSSNTTSVRCI